MLIITWYLVHWKLKGSLVLVLMIFHWKNFVQIHNFCCRLLSTDENVYISFIITSQWTAQTKRTIQDLVLTKIFHLPSLAKVQGLADQSNETVIRWKKKNHVYRQKSMPFLALKWPPLAWLTTLSACDQTTIFHVVLFTKKRAAFHHKINRINVIKVGFTS